MSYGWTHFRGEQNTLAYYGTPEIFNIDQGAQYTRKAFTAVLRGPNIQLIMTGKVRWVDRGGPKNLNNGLSGYALA
ncbi:MAG TPA: hypothetical protein PKK23_13280, partial [Nitrospirales bacterium]|nr:hypothetical protein [Nitrospirales bacterium]